MARFGIAVIGASIRSMTLFDYIKKHPEHGFIAGVYDVVKKRGEYLLKQYCCEQAIIYDSLLQAVNDDRVAAVFIGTPDHAHVEPAVATLAAGKHVYCEKPLAINIKDCDKIIESARDSKAVFYLGMNLRHGPIYEVMHKLLTDGELGKLLTIEANEYYHGGRTYFRRWNRLRKFSGGLWVTKACHDFDLVNWFAGGRAVNVFATSNLSYYKPDADKGTDCRSCKLKQSCPDFYDIDNPDADCDEAELQDFMNKWDMLGSLTEKCVGQKRDICLYNSDKDTFDNGIAVIEYDNDVRATYTLNVVSARATRQIRLMGTIASAEGDLMTGQVKLWKRYSGEVREMNLSEEINSGHGGADDRILADFFKCCQTGNKPRSSWAEGRSAIQLALAARDSCDSGKPVLI